MPNFVVANGRLACAPMDEAVNIKTQGNSFKTALQKNALVRTKVIFCCERVTDSPMQRGSAIQPGSYVYLRGDALTNQWAREVFNLNGEKVVLVPLDQVQVVEVG
jgi:hypothetical protein